MKKVVGALVLSLMSSSLFAEMVLGFGYANFSEDEIDLGLLQGAVGYKVDMGNDFSLTPEVRATVGVGDDSFFGVDVEIDSAFGVALRGQLDFEKDYVWVAPSYSKIKLSANFLGNSASASSDWEFGAGVGLGYQMTENMAFEGSYENVDGASLLDVGIRFKL
jgi:opacity protein-like surface antigen